MLRGRISSLDDAHCIFPLIELIYEAASDASHRPRVFDGKTDAVKGEQIERSAGSAGSGPNRLPMLARLNPPDGKLYSEYFKSANLIADECGAPFPKGAIRHSSMAPPPERPYSQTEDGRISNLGDFSTCFFSSPLCRPFDPCHDSMRI
jgi:hypothetical protein